jgi:pentatricopeptide repeat protein
MSSRARFSTAVTAAAAASRVPRPRAPRIALAAATERVRSGAFGTEDARHLLDELRQRGTPVPERALNGFLAALARAPPTTACPDGPALAVTLLNTMSRAAGPRVLSPTFHTYDILMDCCNRARRPDLAPAFFGRILRTGLGVDVITCSTFLKSLCEAKAD